MPRNCLESRCCNEQMCVLSNESSESSGPDPNPNLTFTCKAMLRQPKAQHTSRSRYHLPKHRTCACFPHQQTHKCTCDIRFPPCVGFGFGRCCCASDAQTRLCVRQGKATGRDLCWIGSACMTRCAIVVAFSPPEQCASLHVCPG